MDEAVRRLDPELLEIASKFAARLASCSCRSAIPGPCTSTDGA